MPSKSRKSRPRVKQEVVLSHFREELAAGRLQPGAQFPTRVDLERTFGVSSVTLQRALDQLIRDGLVVTRGARGTFVADRPPHLHCYALVFPCEPTDRHWRRFYSCIEEEAARQAKALGKTFVSYYGVEGHPDGEHYQRLLHDIRAHRLAGIIFVTAPFELLGTPVLEEGKIPRLSISSRREAPHVPTVRLDRQSFFQKAIEFLASRGRKRLALVGEPNEEQQWIAPLCRRYGLYTQPRWMQGVHKSYAASARNLVDLLVGPEQSIRPDALIISDDNLVEHALGGLVAAGAQVPGDVEVVVHCNFPVSQPSVLPVARLGFCASHVLATCLERIGTSEADRLEAVAIHPVFESERDRATVSGLPTEGPVPSTHIPIQ